MFLLTVIRQGILEQVKSTAGHVFTLGSTSFSRSFKKQQVVALSTVEAEYLAAQNCSSQAIWLIRRLEDLNQKKEKESYNNLL